MQSVWEKKLSKGEKEKKFEKLHLRVILIIKFN